MAVTVTPPVVVTTMPPRNRLVRIAGWPTASTPAFTVPVVAFAVWSNGQITPIVERADQLATYPADGVSGRPMFATWALAEGRAVNVLTDRDRRVQQLTNGGHASGRADQ